MLAVTMTSCSPPVAVAPASAPSFENWLNDLSSSVPTSVTTPTLIGRIDAAGDPAACDAGASEAGASDAGACDSGAATLGDELPLLHAATMMARLLTRVRPRERVRMQPPPASWSRLARPSWRAPVSRWIDRPARAGRHW